MLGVVGLGRAAAGVFAEVDTGAVAIAPPGVVAVVLALASASWSRLAVLPTRTVAPEPPHAAIMTSSASPTVAASADLTTMILRGVWRSAGAGATVLGVSETLSLTIVYEDGGDGWIVASIPEVPGAHSQGHSRRQARENVIDALHGILALRFGEHALSEPASDSEPLELTIAA